MEAITLRAMVREVREECLPGRVQGVSQFSPTDIVLSLGGRGGRSLVLSALPAAAGIHVDTRRLPSLPSPSPLCLVMRRKLAGSVLARVEQQGLERSAHLFFSRSAAAAPAFRVVAEVMGRWSNIILVEEPSSVIVEALRHFPGGKGGGRAVSPGETYRPPPGGDRRDLSALGRGDFLELCRQARREGRPLREVVLGLGPGLMAVAEGRRMEAGGEEDDGLYDALASALEDAGSGRTAPVLYTRRRLVLPFPAGGWEEQGLPFPSVSAAAASLWSEALEAEQRGRLTGRVRRELTRRGKKLRKKEGLLRAEAEEDTSGDLFQAAGQALLSALGEVPRGADSFTFRAPGVTEGETATVPLDPSAGPRRNAELLFKKAKKARKRAESARRRLPALLREIGEVEEALGALPDLPVDELEQLAGEARGRGGKGKRETARGKAPPVREYRSGSWRVLVGKSSRGNDYLTSRIARPEDYWFHVRDNPGAHVVLKAVSGTEEPPPEAIRAAAGIAAWHSALREEAYVDVAFARRKHVRKVKGQPPGKVLLARSSTVRVRPGIPGDFRLVEGGAGPSVVK